MVEEDSLFYGSSKETTPMMFQYFEIKRNYRECLLLFRMGDFFELFFEDAKKAAAILNIALTHRGKDQNQAEIPMCGIPAAALDNYLGRLVRAGHKVAICDQTEDPQEAKKRGYKAIVRREVVRVVTPGTIVEDNLLDFQLNNFLMAIVPDISHRNSCIKTISFSVIDISTGDFFVNTVVKDDFSGIIGLYRPREILLPSYLELGEFATFLSSLTDATFTYLPDTKFNPDIEKRRLEKYFKVQTLESFEISFSNEVAACGALLEYLIITQKNEMPALPAPRKIKYSDYLVIDTSTIRSLGIINGSNDDYSHSLLGVLDRTVTPFGARALASRIVTPIISLEAIKKRLNCVDYFVKDRKLCESLRDVLSQSADFERSINRIKFNKFSPKNVGDIRELLHIISKINAVVGLQEVPFEGDYSFFEIKDFSELAQILDAALVDYSALSVANKRAEGIIANGYSKELDGLKYLKDHSKALIARLQEKYISLTGISTLKIKENAILGWYVEIPLSQKNRMPPLFVHRQTLVGNVRYITEELSTLQERLLVAMDDWSKLEEKLYNEIVQKILNRYEDILYAIKCLAQIDIYTCFAKLSVERGYVRPTMVDEAVMEIENGKHPILALNYNDFTSNDCDLDSDHRIALLTGPNMAGKSTYLRQNALIIIMAQIGCYVPATSAKIGVVDRLFSRIGASDDIVRGRSTFMVEMIETATILNQATEKSFVILDEVGRGTSTYDGLSIAWAVMENLYKVNRCRVLFATHYRELVGLQRTLTNIRCKTLKVQEWEGEVIFYHKIINGVADKSYGIHVASIAGVPKKVIQRAKQLLKNFEDKAATREAKRVNGLERGNENGAPLEKPQNADTLIMESLFDFDE